MTDSDHNTQPLRQSREPAFEQYRTSYCTSLCLYTRNCWDLYTFNILIVYSLFIYSVKPTVDAAAEIPVDLQIPSPALG